MTTKTKTGDQILDSFAAGSRWQDALMELFWAVDEAVKENRASGIPTDVFQAYTVAEAARQRLAAT